MEDDVTRIVFPEAFADLGERTADMLAGQVRQHGEVWEVTAPVDRFLSMLDEVAGGDKFKKD